MTSSDEPDRATEEINRRLREHFAQYGWGGTPTRQPRYRYYQRANGPLFCWTTERFEGKFVSFVYRPIGKGARSGKASEWQLVKVGKWKSVKHSRRKDAKARALRLFMADQVASAS